MIGPKRLVLICAGKYDYAEIDLTESVHLVGPNNVGKTTLVNALQFLYIDHQQQMHFGGWSLRESLKYYFPEPHSFVLFECSTPEGTKVVGLRGLGVAQQYRYERFVYTGTYDRSDYLDENGTVRTADEVKGRLAVKGYRSLEPKDLRVALTGHGDDKDIALRLVPTRQSDGYGQFKTVFGNLLRLSRLRQHELKALLIDIYQAHFVQQEISLSDYDEQVERIRRLAKGVDRIEQHRPLIEDTLALVTEVEAVENELAPMRGWIAGAYARETRELEQNETALQERQKEIEKQLSELAQQKKQLQSEEASRNQEIGELKAVFREIEALRGKFSGISAADIEVEVARHEEELRQERQQHFEASQKPLSELQKAHRKLHNEIQSLQRRIEAFDQLAGAYLSQTFAADELDRIFTVLNPALLDVRLDQDGAEVTDRERLVQSLRILEERTRTEQLEAFGVRLPLGIVEQKSHEDLLDKEARQARLQAMQQALRTLESKIKRAKDVEAHKQRVEVLQDRRDQARDRLKAYGLYREKLTEEADLKERYGAAVAAVDRLRQALDEVEEAVEELKTEQRKGGRAVTDIQNQIKELSDSVRAVDALPDGESADPLSTDRSTVELVKEFKQRRSKIDDLNQKIQGNLYILDKATYGRAGSGGPADALKSLQDDLAGLEEQKQALQEMWRTLVSVLSKAFGNLLKDLNKLEGFVQELNRMLANMQVSDLKEQRLNVKKRQQMVHLLKNVVEDEEHPLFSDPSKREEMLDKVSNLLAKHPTIHLEELFAIEISVRQADDQLKSYNDIDTLQSNGTSITLKVLINLLLLHRLFGRCTDCRVPFFLDEASSMDRSNLRGIIRQAEALGFIPILASPEPVEAAAQVYWPQESNGRVYLDATHAMRFTPVTGTS